MKSLELNWIRKFDKSLVIPEIVFSSLDWADGLYYHPDKKEIYIDEKFYSLEYGLIEVSYKNNNTIDETASTLAHEWRHHWQKFNLPIDEYNYYWPQTFDSDEYNKMILKYFTVNQLEMDALQFQKKYSSIHENWEEILHDYL